MKIFDIDGNLVGIQVTRSSISRKKSSKQHILTRSVLSKLYNYDVVIEEFQIPGSQLSVDFFVPRKNLVIEVQGEQHNEHTPFFHGDKSLFKLQAQQNRDLAKQNWCEINDLALIEINANDTESDINRKLGKP